MPQRLSIELNRNISLHRPDPVPRSLCSLFAFTQNLATALRLIPSHCFFPATALKRQAARCRTTKAAENKRHYNKHNSRVGTCRHWGHGVTDSSPLEGKQNQDTLFHSNPLYLKQPPGERKIRSEKSRASHAAFFCREGWAKSRKPGSGLCNQFY